MTAWIAALSVLLTNVNSILSNLRALPAEIQKTSDQFFNWYGDYNGWKGYWTNFPEGFNDMEAMNLSKEDFRLNIDQSKDGLISGTLETRGVCNKVPYLHLLLVDGSISSSSRAEVEIFDFVGGYRRNFARLELRRDDYIMTVIPLDDPGRAFAAETRIARAPPDLVGGDGLETLCGEKRAKFVRDAFKKAQADPPTGLMEK